MTPIFINNFNRLEPVKALLADFDRFNSVTPIHVTIVDNNSAYPPLLEWYAELNSNSDLNSNTFHLPHETPVTIHRRSDNGGPRGYYAALKDLNSALLSRIDWIVGQSPSKSV